MHKPGLDEPAVVQPSHAFRGDSSALAALLQDVPPVASDSHPELFQASPIAWHRVILVGCAGGNGVSTFWVMQTKGEGSRLEGAA
jgi:hypothetical protein